MDWKSASAEEFYARNILILRSLSLITLRTFLAWHGWCSSCRMVRKPNIRRVDDKAPQRASTGTNCPLVCHCRGIVSIPLTANETAQLQGRARVSPVRAAQRPNESVLAKQCVREACPTTKVGISAIPPN